LQLSPLVSTELEHNDQITASNCTKSSLEVGHNISQEILEVIGKYYFAAYFHFNNQSPWVQLMTELFKW